MQNYSSGMRVRLNFALASSLKPDVLLLDEVLAVGDAAFRDKCYHRIAQLRHDVVVVFVSHSMEQIARTSTNAFVMHRGQVLYCGDVDEGIKIYEKINQKSACSIIEDSFLSLYHPINFFTAKISKSEYCSGDVMEIMLDFESEESMNDFALKVLFYNSRGAFAADGFIHSSKISGHINSGTNQFKIRIDSLPLKNGFTRLL